MITPEHVRSITAVVTLTLPALLEQWSEIEPERCDMRKGAGGPPSVSLGGAPHYSWAGPVSRAVVLAAVIEAIEARGAYWDARSHGSSSHRFYTATVEDEVAHGEIGEPLVVPLLSAYLTALEVE